MADTIVKRAVRNANISGSDVGNELIKLEDEMRVRRDLQESKSNPARQAAEKAATSTSEGSVKKTVYPYVAPSRGGGAGGRGGGAMRGAGGGGGSLPGLEDAMRKGGKVKKYSGGGSVSASKRADGIAQRGKTRGTVVACKGGKM